jgi:2-oxoglutarate ferredoxin oxidoreductase subunit delta
VATRRASLARGRMVVNEATCKGCELCTAVCPYDLIRMADYYNAKGYRPAMLLDPENCCTGCTLCAMICPDAAITVFRLVKARTPARRSTKTSTPRTVAV